MNMGANGTGLLVIVLEPVILVQLVVEVGFILISPSMRNWFTCDCSRTSYTGSTCGRGRFYPYLSINEVLKDGSSSLVIALEPVIWIQHLVEVGSTLICLSMRY